MVRYVVRYGDSLWLIAKRHLGDPDAWVKIADLNGLQTPNQLYVGQVISLPLPDKTVQGVHRLSLNRESRHLRNDGLGSHRIQGFPGRAFFFIIADEWNPLTKKLVRKVAAPQKPLSPEQLNIIMNPDKYGFRPRAPGSSTTMAEHVAKEMTGSGYVSASRRYFGSPNYPGQRYWINEDMLRKSGYEIYDQEEIQREISELAKRTKNPKELEKILELAEKSAFDKEVLLKGPNPDIAAPNFAIKGALSEGLTRVFQLGQGISILLTAKDVVDATQQSIEQNSFKPIGKVVASETGGWAGGVAGRKVGIEAAKLAIRALLPTLRTGMTAGGLEGALVGAELGGMQGALVTVETGPGVVVGAAVGSLLMGAVGYIGSEMVADYVFSKLEDATK